MGLENLIAAFARVRAAQPDALLYIAGTGPLRADLEAEIRARDLTDHVRLLGFVPDRDLPSAYRAADLSVVPTVRLEGFGLITVESLAAGTPVLVTPVGGLPETVGALSEALVLPAATVDALAHGLTAALRTPTSLPSRSSCRAYARSTFGWPAIARRTREVYAEAAHARGPY
jgi:glycosyltransferase involved in cell wall biosynthesis